MRITLLCLLLAAAGWTMGCASGPPRVHEVTGRIYRNTVARADEDIFVPDRASQFKWRARALPPDQQRQEFYVRWAGVPVHLVVFEYRQVQQPNQVRTLTVDPAPGQRSTTFVVRGEEFATGGAVSAWRVSLWTDPQTRAAEMVSALW
ncbi:hypothetical protein HQ590_11185 [bacterium]|nr:hypothetical protein [bacterium]